MSRFLGKLLVRALTGESFEANVTNALSNFYLKNNLTDVKLKKYLIDKSEIHNSYYRRHLIGRAKHNGKKTGVIITHDEGCGYTSGRLFPIKYAKQAKRTASEYKKEKKQGYVNCLSSYFLFRTCDHDYTGLIDSNGDLSLSGEEVKNAYLD